MSKLSNLTAPQGISIHDQRRKDDLIKALVKAKEKAETAGTYLSTNNRDLEEIMNVDDVIVHIEIALERLGVETNADPG